MQVEECGKGVLVAALCALNKTAFGFVCVRFLLAWKPI
jgi:hypothetical protein